ncbi:MAG: hypothetical protein GY874_12345 [Desulfobacteraceae bacterium]|nr:hypothetical protein [Desulfobacteraceae bacterium]
MISLESKCKLLQTLYDIHQKFCGSLTTACKKHCAACCSCNVTMTSLEGYLILRYLKQNNLTHYMDRIKTAAFPKRFIPAMTINRMAQLCAKDEPLPEEEIDPDSGPCGLVADEICSVYPVRPFACRAMVSTVHCSSSDQAVMPDLAFTVNHVLMQYIEGIDIPGITGNMADVLTHMYDSQQLHHFERQEPMITGGMQTNQPVPVLMAPPEHRDSIQPILAEIQRAVRNTFMQSGIDG